MSEKPESIVGFDKEIRVEVYLEAPEPGQRPRGIFYRDAYVLRTSSSHAKHPDKQLTNRQEERGAALADQLLGRMIERLSVSGWQPVARTKAGLPIWQHRLAPAPARHVISEQEVGIVSDLVEHQSRIYAVYGDGTKEEKKAAKKSGQKPAYTRVVKTKTVTLACSKCGNTVAEEHFPGAKPRYCKPCAEIVRREKTLARVKNYYATHPDKHRGSTKKSVN